MKPEKMLEMAERLEAWAEHPAKDTRGICLRIGSHFGTQGRLWIHQTSQKWPEYSGIPAYPVPAPEGFGTYNTVESKSVAAFYDLPRWEGEYGDSRRRLCKWLAAMARGEAYRLRLVQKYKTLYLLAAEILDRIPEEGNKSIGVCFNLKHPAFCAWPEWVQREHIMHLRDCMREFFPAWKFYSGDNEYPIPGGAEVYQNYNLPKWEGEQGKYRRDLCQFLVASFREKARKLK